jgi:hypothetical protein
MKTKMKTKLVVSICALTLIFTACNKDAVVPLDCMGVENGTSMIDDCDVCLQAYIYNFVTHAVVLLNDTSGVIAPAGEMIFMPNDSLNPYWNASCTDCDGILNGVAVVDSCGDCQGAYIYNMLTHNPNEIVMLGGDTTGASAILTTGQVIILPEDDGNPYWNAGCK